MRDMRALALLPLELDRLSLRSDSHDHDGISLASARAAHVIVGPNGAGKSVLLRLCHGLLNRRRHDTLESLEPLVDPASGNGVSAAGAAAPNGCRHCRLRVGDRGVSRGQRLARALDALRRVGLGHPAATSNT